MFLFDDTDDNLHSEIENTPLDCGDKSRTEQIGHKTDQNVNEDELDEQEDDERVTAR